MKSSLRASSGSLSTQLSSYVPICEDLGTVQVVPYKTPFIAQCRKCGYRGFTQIRQYQAKAMMGCVSCKPYNRMEEEDEKDGPHHICYECKTVLARYEKADLKNLIKQENDTEAFYSARS